MRIAHEYEIRSFDLGRYPRRLFSRTRVSLCSHPSTMLRELRAVRAALDVFLAPRAT